MTLLCHDTELLPAESQHGEQPSIEIILSHTSWLSPISLNSKPSSKEKLSGH